MAHYVSWVQAKSKKIYLLARVIYTAILLPLIKHLVESPHFLLDLKKPCFIEALVQVDADEMTVIVEAIQNAILAVILQPA